MRVLVAAASRHGSTQEIGLALADYLSAQGFEADYRDIADVTAIEGYQAFVLGSAVYMGRWLGEARDFLMKHHDILPTRPVWLFSSGPLGTDTDQPALQAKTVQELTGLVAARDHQTFAGKLERDDLSGCERLVMRVVHAPTGDFRDWDAIQRWSSNIGQALEGPSPVAPPANDHVIDAMIRAL